MPNPKAPDPHTSTNTIGPPACSLLEDLVLMVQINLHPNIYRSSDAYKAACAFLKNNSPTFTL